jgi:hypothetical protein
MIGMKIFTVIVAATIALSGCAARPDAEGGYTPATGSVANDAAERSAAAPASTPTTSTQQPKNIRDFFTLLPEKYFVLEGCDRSTDKDCKKARAEYLRTFTEVEDVANGYFKGGCDGGQRCIEMAIFKRPDETYLVGVATSGEMLNDFYFLDYANGKWTDVSSRDVPEFSKKLWYELPRVGTTVKVFEKKVTEKGADFEATEKGKKLYDLVWKDGTFKRQG